QGARLSAHWRCSRWPFGLSMRQPPPRGHLSRCCSRSDISPSGATGHPRLCTTGRTLVSICAEPTAPSGRFPLLAPRLWPALGSAFLPTLLGDDPLSLAGAGGCMRVLMVVPPLPTSADPDT